MNQVRDPCTFKELVQTIDTHLNNYLVLTSLVASYPSHAIPQCDMHHVSKDLCATILLFQAKL